MFASFPSFIHAHLTDSTNCSSYFLRQYVNTCMRAFLAGFAIRKSKDREINNEESIPHEYLNLETRQKR